MKHLYHLWHAGVDSTHHANYWNTRYGKMYWMHGGDCTRDEPVNPTEERGIDLRFESTADSGRIIDKLNAMSHEEFKFDLLS